jgi:hypothetical protein
MWALSHRERVDILHIPEVVLLAEVKISINKQEKSVQRFNPGLNSVKDSTRFKLQYWGSWWCNIILKL